MPSDLLSSTAPGALLPAEDNPDLVLVGVPAIAKFMNETERAVRHLIAIGAVPAFQLRGSSIWRLRPRTLHETYRQLESEAIARGAERRAQVAAANGAPPPQQKPHQQSALARDHSGRWLVNEAQKAAKAKPKRPPPRRKPRPCEQWAPESISTAVADLILLEIDEGLANGSVLFSNHPYASEARSVTRIVRKHLPSVSDHQARQIVAAWIKDGVLVEVEFRTKRGLQKGLKLTPTIVAREESPRRSVKRRNGDAAAQPRKSVSD
jgi:hypothetical protein